MKERIQKILSARGLASRRTAESWIRAGRVRVNGAVCTLGASADPDADRIEVDGVPLPPPPGKKYLMLNKPRGYVTTLSDEKGRKNVSELVADCGGRVYPVGRLDLNSEGLLIMTNDGEFANRLMHPSREIEKTYLVWVSGWRAECLAALKEPIDIDSRMTAPAKVRVLREQDQTALLEFVIHEGRNRQLCEAADVRVTRLRRIREGALALGELPVGAWRALTEAELDTLQNEL